MSSYWYDSGGNLVFKTSFTSWGTDFIPVCVVEVESLLEPVFCQCFIRIANLNARVGVSMPILQSLLTLDPHLPKPVDIAVMHPEQRVEGRSRETEHEAAGSESPKRAVDVVVRCLL